ncbi:hypothetical protein ABZW18_34330 [Streptomyces sp. NPDC004647]|uniref:hypothetical protein n=1 Tax=Streptomyces sp. NPDC004647 TaxID=3154671 RepID=UPI0033B66270
MTALLLTFGAVNAYLAGGARLGVALSQAGTMPRRLVTGPAAAGNNPGRSLTVLMAASTAITLASALGMIGLDTLLRATSACLIAVTLAGASTVLLPRRRALWYGALLSSAVMSAVLVFCGLFLPVPAALAVAASTFQTVRAARTPPSPPVPPALKGRHPEYDQPAEKSCHVRRHR